MSKLNRRFHGAIDKLYGKPADDRSVAVPVMRSAVRGPVPVVSGGKGKAPRSAAESVIREARAAPHRQHDSDAHVADTPALCGRIHDIQLTESKKPKGMI